MRLLANRFRIACLTSAALAALACGLPAYADDSFFTVAAAGSSGTVVNVGGHDIEYLTDSILLQDRRFSALYGQSVNSTLSFGGVQNAIRISENAAQTQATLSFPTAGISQTFTTTTNSPSLAAQVRYFLEQNVDGDYAQFLKRMDQTSTVAVIDGNPQAATAFIADDAFNRWGWQSTGTAEPANAAPIGDVSADIGGGSIGSDHLGGYYVNDSLQWSPSLSDVVSLSFAFNSQFGAVGGSSNGSYSGEFGVPITVLNVLDAVGNRKLDWQVTPWTFIGVASSDNQLAGAMLTGAGLTSSVTWNVNDFSFILGDQVGYETNIDNSFDYYNYDVPVDQWIVKNGAQAIWHPGNSPLFVNAGVAYSDFLEAAAVRNYWTPIAGVGFSFSPRANLRLSYEGDYASHYHSSGGMISVYIAY